MHAVRTKANEVVRHPVFLDQGLDTGHHLLINKAVERVHHALRHLVAVVCAGIQGCGKVFLAARRVFLAAACDREGGRRLRTRKTLASHQR